MMRFLWWIPSLLLALMSPVLAQDSTLIGVYLPLSGNLGAAGRLMLEGIRVAHTMRPQVLNRPVELKVVDTRSEKVEAANAVFRLVEKDHVTAIIGEMVSGTTSAGSFHAERRGIALVTPRATSPKVICGDGYALRVCPIDGDQAGHAANLAMNCLDARTAAIIYDMSDDHSIGLAASFKRDFTRAGGRILLQTRIKTGDRDFMAQVNQIKTAKPDIIYAPLYCVECALIARQARDMGVDATVMAGDAVHLPELLELGGKSVEGLIFTTYFHESMIHTEMGTRFRDLYLETDRKTTTRCPSHGGRHLSADSRCNRRSSFSGAGKNPGSPFFFEEL